MTSTLVAHSSRVHDMRDVLICVWAWLVISESLKAILSRPSIARGMSHQPVTPDAKYAKYAKARGCILRRVLWVVLSIPLEAKEFPRKVC
jgi:hypothetical protein